MPLKDKSILVFSSSPKRDLIISIGEDIKLLITREGARTKLVIEAPKNVGIKKMNDLERALAEVVNQC